MLLLVVSTVVRAQQSPNSENSDSSNIYYSTLRNYFGNMRGEKKVLIEQNDFLFPFLRYQFDTTGFEFVDRLQIISKAKKQNGLTVYRIIPLKINTSSELYVSIIQFTVHYKKGKLEFINNGGGKVYYGYDCSNKIYQYLRTQNVVL